MRHRGDSGYLLVGQTHGRNPAQIVPGHCFRQPNAQTVPGTACTCRRLSSQSVRAGWGPSTMQAIP